MDDALAIAARAIPIGVGATAVMDLWARFMWRSFGVPSLDYRLIGRWIGHFPRGRFRHESIGHAAPVRYEGIIGWTAHYTIGIVFAALLLVIWGLDWLDRPTLVPALTVSSATLVAPFLVMQPAMGAGIAATVVTTLSINVPINTHTASWQLTDDSSEWQHMRRRWHLFQGVRGWLFASAFVLLTIALV